MKNLISAYLWGFRNIEAGNKTFQKFRELYPESDLFCRIDIDGDIKNYKSISDRWGAKFSVNRIKVGYCGDFGSSKHFIGRDGWPKENVFEWLTGIYDACTQTSAKYMIILEEDVFILKPISILNEEFGAAIVRNDNRIPPVIMQFIHEVGGNTNVMKYGCCGGCIINVNDFIKGWELSKDKLWEEYDNIFLHTKLIGWADCILQVVIQCADGKVIINKQLVEPWMLNKRWIDMHWKNFEIVNYLKNIDEIRQL